MDRFDRRAARESGIFRGPIGPLESPWVAIQWVVGSRVEIRGSGGGWKHACAALGEWRAARAADLRLADQRQRFQPADEEIFGQGGVK